MTREVLGDGETSVDASSRPRSELGNISRSSMDEPQPVTPPTGSQQSLSAAAYTTVLRRIVSASSASVASSDRSLRTLTAVGSEASMATCNFISDFINPAHPFVPQRENSFPTPGSVSGSDSYSDGGAPIEDLQRLRSVPSAHRVVVGDVEGLISPSESSAQPPTASTTPQNSSPSTSPSAPDSRSSIARLPPLQTPSKPSARKPHTRPTSKLPTAGTLASLHSTRTPSIDFLPFRSPSSWSAAVAYGVAALSEAIPCLKCEETITFTRALAAATAVVPPTHPPHPGTAALSSHTTCAIPTPPPFSPVWLAAPLIADGVVGVVAGDVLEYFDLVDVVGRGGGGYVFAGVLCSVPEDGGDGGGLFEGGHVSPAAPRRLVRIPLDVVSFGTEGGGGSGGGSLVCSTARESGTGVSGLGVSSRGESATPPPSTATPLQVCPSGGVSRVPRPISTSAVGSPTSVAMPPLQTSHAKCSLDANQLSPLPAPIDSAAKMISDTSSTSALGPRNSSGSRKLTGWGSRGESVASARPPAWYHGTQLALKILTLKSTPLSPSASSPTRGVATRQVDDVEVVYSEGESEPDCGGGGTELKGRRHCSKAATVAHSTASKNPSTVAEATEKETCAALAEAAVQHSAAASGAVVPLRGLVFCTTSGIPAACLVMERGVACCRDVVNAAPAGGLKDSVVLPLLAGVVVALARLHAASYVHGDVKDANVIVMYDGSVLLCDIAVGASVRAEVALASDSEGRIRPGRCGGGALHGTPHFMPPEAAGGAPPSAAGDVWALGVLAYTLVMGGPPYAHVAPRRALVVLRNATLQPLTLSDTRHHSAAVAAVGVFMEQCTARSSHNRPSAWDLLSHEAVAPWVTYAPDGLPLLTSEAKALCLEAATVARSRLHPTVARGM